MVYALSGPMVCKMFLCFPKETVCNIVFFCSVTSGSGEQREDGCHGHSVYFFPLAMEMCSWNYRQEDELTIERFWKAWISAKEWKDPPPARHPDHNLGFGLEGRSIFSWFSANTPKNHFMFRVALKFLLLLQINFEISSPCSVKQARNAYFTGYFVLQGRFALQGRRQSKTWRMLRVSGHLGTRPTPAMIEPQQGAWGQVNLELSRPSQRKRGNVTSTTSRLQSRRPKHGAKNTLRTLFFEFADFPLREPPKNIRTPPWNAFFLATEIRLST